jgi:hypothetical protein
LGETERRSSPLALSWRKSASFQISISGHRWAFRCLFPYHVIMFFSDRCSTRRQTRLAWCYAVKLLNQDQSSIDFSHRLSWSPSSTLFQTAILPFIFVVKSTNTSFIFQTVMTRENILVHFTNRKIDFWRQSPSFLGPWRTVSVLSLRSHLRNLRPTAVALISYHRLGSPESHSRNYSSDINHLICHCRTPAANQMWF